MSVQITSEHEELQARATELESSLTEATKELEAAKESNEELTNEVCAIVSRPSLGAPRSHSLGCQVDEKDSEIAEMKVNHKVQLRMTRQLNKELKAQLAKESKRVSLLEAQLVKAKEDAANALAAASARPPPPPANSTPKRAARCVAHPCLLAPPCRAVPCLTPGCSASTSSLRLAVPRWPSSPSAASSDRGGGSSQAGSVASPSNAGSAGGSTPSTPDDPVKRMLAQRLEQLLSQNAAVREKVKYLESTVQDLAQELNAEKLLTAQLSGKGGSQIYTEEIVARTMHAASTTHSIAAAIACVCVCVWLCVCGCVCVAVCVWLCVCGVCMCVWLHSMRACWTVAFRPHTRLHPTASSTNPLATSQALLEKALIENARLKVCDTGSVDGPCLAHAVCVHSETCKRWLQLSRLPRSRLSDGVVCRWVCEGCSWMEHACFLSTTAARRHQTHTTQITTH